MSNGETRRLIGPVFAWPCARSVPAPRLQECQDHAASCLLGDNCCCTCIRSRSDTPAMLQTFDSTLTFSPWHLTDTTSQWYTSPTPRCPTGGYLRRLTSTAKCSPPPHNRLSSLSGPPLFLSSLGSPLPSLELKPHTHVVTLPLQWLPLGHRHLSSISHCRDLPVGAPTAHMGALLQ